MNGGRRRGGLLFALVSLALVAPANARAQVSVGDSVRVRLNGALRVEAMTTGLRGDTLLLSLSGVTTTWPVSMSDLESLEAFIDRSPRDGLRYGAMIGAGAGLFAGALGGIGLYAIGLSGAEVDRATGLMSAVLTWSGIGVVAGAVVGAVLGGQRPGRGWVAIPLPGH